MAYAAISYPEISNLDYKKIQEYRRENDNWPFNLIKPHITLVFPVTEMEERNFVTEIEDLSFNMHKIDFVFRCAIIKKIHFLTIIMPYLPLTKGSAKWSNCMIGSIAEI